MLAKGGKAKSTESRKQADDAPAIPVSGLMDNLLVRYNNTNRTYKHMTRPLQHASASEYQAAYARRTPVYANN